MAGILAPKARIRIGRQGEVIPAKKLMSVAKVIQRIVWLQIMYRGLPRISVDQANLFRRGTMVPNF
jgi:hypothetical protein